MSNCVRQLKGGLGLTGNNNCVQSDLSWISGDRILGYLPDKLTQPQQGHYLEGNLSRTIVRTIFLQFSNVCNGSLVLSVTWYLFHFTIWLVVIWSSAKSNTRSSEQTKWKYAIVILFLPVMQFGQYPYAMPCCKLLHNIANIDGK